MKIFKSAKGREQVLQSYNRLLEQWSVAYQEADVETRYGVTHCIIAGNPDHPPLLLFHGVGDNSAVMWMLNMKALSKHYYCIAVDTIGGPGKSVPNENYNKKRFEQVDWINQVADQLRLERFHIAGVSNGAYMAFNYVVHEPERVKKVVCMEGGMVTSPIKSMVQTLLMMFPEMLVPTRSNLNKILRKLSSPNSRVFDRHPELADHLVLLMKQHNQQAMFVHKLQLYDKHKAAGLKEKLYFLMGDYKLNHKEEFLSVLKDGGFPYKIISDAGHGVNHEQPEAVQNEMIRFLSEADDVKIGI
ncbi:alpha/beta fold hydrolase [Paenibacillus sp. NEAU-GSW1]|uniref:alpha/beta fold hydrolase n=1 Tax=Paenibacillus sp. NEAU-GSW1 TaxID=2682486 RepID=UPI0012E2AEB4|nr:alpha/beta hydrolase [Paenibacillus sp. NEAU-GSW1]MUT68318.1 alpha/beta fold hydrolase [Paenibacillus sp. NEAU-GSW1]